MWERFIVVLGKVKVFYSAAADGSVRRKRQTNLASLLSFSCRLDRTLSTCAVVSWPTLVCVTYTQARYCVDVPRAGEDISSAGITKHYLLITEFEIIAIRSEECRQ